MKTHMRLHGLFAALLPGLCAGLARAETPPADLTASNLTIHASASFGLIYANGAGHQAALPGFRVRVSQSTTGGTVVNTSWHAFSFPHHSRSQLINLP